MGYRYLTDERRNHIKKVAKGIKATYSKGRDIDFYSLARDFHVNFSEIPEAGAGFSRGSDIIVPKRLIPSFGRWEKAHEFGHVILGHTYSNTPYDISEDETNYFAERLTGFGKIKIAFPILLEALLFGLMYPIKHRKYDES